MQYHRHSLWRLPYREGFALPTVLVAGVLMMIVLLSSLQAAVSIRTLLTAQYRDQLTREASESGAIMAETCMRENDFVITWTEAKPLQPHTDCHGDAVTGRSQYLIDTPTLRTTFRVAPPPSGSMVVDAVGIVSQQRLSSSGMSSSGATTQRSEHATKGLVVNSPMDSTSVSSGIAQVCSVLGGKSWCNGANNVGQVGNGKAEGSKLYLEPSRVVRLAGALEGKTDKFVVSGLSAACTVTTDNEIYCWGNNSYRYLGTGTSTNPMLQPTRVSKPVAMQGKEITNVVLGWSTACAIADGDLFCWGRNQYGQIGDNSTTQRNTPVRTSVIGTTNGKPVTDVSSSPYSDFTCAVASGDAYCWGRNQYGQLGDNTTTSRLVPTLVTKQAGHLQGKTVVQIVQERAPRMLDGSVTTEGGGSDRAYYTQSHACALTSDGQVYCWGGNRYGQMGQGSYSNTNQLTPIRVQGNLSGKTVRSIATSYRTPCALTDDPDDQNRLYCWGGNQYGAAAVGHEQGCANSGTYTYMCSPRAVAMQTPGLQDKHIDFIAAGVNRVCAITAGVNYCAGYNAHGQIGDGTQITRTVPTEAKVFRYYHPTVFY